MKNPNKFREFALLVSGGLLFTSIILVNLTRIIAFGVLGIMAIVSYVVSCLAFWVCPNCKKHLPWKSEKIYFCPYCGYQIEEQQK